MSNNPFPRPIHRRRSTLFRAERRKARGDKGLSERTGQFSSFASRIRRSGQPPARGPAANGSEATATTEMPNLSYDEMDKLTPCRVCGSRRYWFDGEAWQCWNWAPPPSADMVRVDLDDRVNQPDDVSDAHSLEKMRAATPHSD